MTAKSEAEMIVIPPLSIILLFVNTLFLSKLYSNTNSANRTKNTVMYDNLAFDAENLEK